MLESTFTTQKQFVAFEKEKLSIQNFSSTMKKKIQFEENIFNFQ
jgi:hypothetical protein